MPGLDAEDFSALKAHANIETHEKICAERYREIKDDIREIKDDIKADRIARAAETLAIHTRFNTISNRMWTSVAGVAAFAVVCLITIAGTVGFHLLTRGSH